MRRTLPLALLALLAGCERATLYIESDTAWSGYVTNSAAGQSFDGRGSQQVELGGGISCWTISKSTRGGYLRAYARGGTNGTQGRAETRAEFGAVSGCTGGGAY